VRTPAVHLDACSGTTWIAGMDFEWRDPHEWSVVHGMRLAVKSRFCPEIMYGRKGRESRAFRAFSLPGGMRAGNQSVNSRVQAAEKEVKKLIDRCE